MNSPLRVLVVGERSEELALAASGQIAAARCHHVADLAGALDALAAQPIDAVVCALDGHEGRRLFQIMHACYAGVWRVLLTDAPAANAAAALADACVPAGADGAPWHLVSALRLAPRPR